MERQDGSVVECREELDKWVNWYNFCMGTPGSLNPPGNGKQRRKFSRQVAAALTQMGIGPTGVAIESKPMQPGRGVMDRLSLGDTFTVLGVLVGVFLVIYAPALPFKVIGLLFLCVAMIWLAKRSYWTYSLGKIAKWSIGIALCAAMWVVCIPQFVVQWQAEHIPRRHTFSPKERAEFKAPLKQKKDVTLDIQIGCPATDGRACTFASQFIPLFGESGWKINPILQRITLIKEQEGITVYRKAGNKDFALKHWDAAGFYPINEPHLLAVQKAFQAIGFEPEGATNPELTDTTMMIYFGPEKQNEGEPTSLTRTTKCLNAKDVAQCLLFTPQDR